MFNLKKGELPLSQAYFLRDKRKCGDVFVFGEDTFMVGLKNSLYKGSQDDEESAVYCSDWYICITNLSGEIMVYNPKLKMYEKFFKDSGNYTDSSSTSEMRTYLKDLEQYIHIDYKHHSDCYILDINRLLKDISPELRIQNDENHYISLYSSGVKVKCPFLRNYQDNFDYNIMRNKPDHYYASFMRPSEIYSFHNELKDFIETSNLGSKFSNIYDKVVGGDMTKEDFLKEVVV